MLILIIVVILVILLAPAIPGMLRYMLGCEESSTKEFKSLSVMGPSRPAYRSPQPFRRVIYYYSRSCPYSRQYEPIFKRNVRRIRRRYPGIRVQYVDAGSIPLSVEAKRYGIERVPTVCLQTGDYVTYKVPEQSRGDLLSYIDYLIRIM